MRNLVILPIYFLLIFGCEDPSSEKLGNGTYSGEYKVFNHFGTSEENWSSGIIELTIDENGYRLTANTLFTPPSSVGQCDWTETTITFQDTIEHTANFDWTLIINGTYNYGYDGSILELSQTDSEQNRKYTYNLTKD